MEVAVGILGAVVVLVVGLIGHRQWRTSHTSTLNAPYRADRIEAYKRLWELISDAELSARRDADYLRTLQATQRELGTLLVQRAPVLDEPDVKLARELLDAMRSFRERLDREGTAEQRQKVEITMDFDSEVLTSLHEDDNRFLDARAKLIRRVQRVLRSAPSDRSRR